MPEGIPRCGAGEQRSGGFIEDGELGIHPLEVLRGTHGSVGIGRGKLEKEAIQSLAQAIDVQAQIGRDWRQSFLLQGAIWYGVVRRGCGFIRPGGQDLEQARGEAVRLRRSHPIQFGEGGGDVVLQFVENANCVLSKGGRGAEGQPGRSQRESDGGEFHSGPVSNHNAAGKVTG